VSTEGLTPYVFEEFNGVQTLPEAMDVQPGYATDSRNVEYRLGSSCASRPGRTVLTTIPGGQRILSMAEFTLLDSVTRRLLIVTADGVLWKEMGDTTVQQVETGLGANTRIAQQTMFGRQYMAFSDGKLGSAPPRYYDDTRMARVSQSGPGAAPTVVDGPAGVLGTINPGLHYFRVIYEFFDGSRSAPGPAAAYTAPGGVQASVIVPLGPSNVARRIICATATLNPAVPPAGGTYFFLPDTPMVVNDNVTVGPVLVDFSDLGLTSGENVTDSLFQFVLPEQAGVTAFHERLVWWGGQNNLFRVADDGLLNMDFDGGFYSTQNGNVPNGWTAFFPGCNVVSDVPGSTGAVFRIMADGIGQRGTIQNNVMGLALNTLISPNRAYGGRLRVRRSPGLTQGSVSLYFLSQGSVVVGGGGGLTIPFASLSTDWQEFTGVIYPATPILPSDLVLKISGGKGGDGFTQVLAPANEWIDVDFAGLYPLNQPFTPSLLYLSKPGQPAVYDENGLILVSENDGQAIRRCFSLRDHLFIIKENSVHVATDTGDDPVNWPLDPVLTAEGDPLPCGTYSINGVGMGEGWCVFAAEAGLYFFAGGFAIKLSEEIQPTWDRINWQYGHLIVVKVDALQKRIFIQVPFDGATDINRTLYLDWVGQSPLEKRNWCPEFDTPASSMALSRRSDGTLAMLFGTQDATGRILRFDLYPGLDAGDAYPMIYQTAFVGGSSGRNSFQYLTATVRGAGTLLMWLVYPDGTLVEIRPTELRNDFEGDVEWPGLRANAERIALRFGTLNAGDWFVMRKLVLYGRPHPWSRVRGQAA
jgi:hypothetical protein